MGKSLYAMPIAIIVAGALIGGGLAYGLANLGGGTGLLSEQGGDIDVTADPEEPSEIVLRDVTNADHIRGKRDASITIVEYSDLECPFCKQFHTTMMRLLQDYPDDVRWVYRHFPLTQLHPKAPKEAEAAECATELAGNDGFWKYVDRLFEITPSNNGLDLKELSQIAEDVGINRKQFEECLNSGKYTQKIEADIEDAISAGARGTPYSVIFDAKGNKTPINGALPYENIKSYIEKML